jgi:glucose/arabinose dehydrogenase
MTLRLRFFAFLVFCGGATSCLFAAAAESVGPFFEPDQPFFQSQVQLVAPPQGQLAGGNFVVRGIVLPLASGHCVVFDQELLRIAGLWPVPSGETPITLHTMAQVSYANPRRKVGGEHPQPTGPLLLVTGMHPGVASDATALFEDPRPPRSPGDEGRGALPATFARFEGVELAGPIAVLRYRSGDVVIREWLESRSDGGQIQILRHFEIAPHTSPLHFAIGAAGGAAWTVEDSRTAAADNGDLGRIRAEGNSPALALREERGELIVTFASSTILQRASLALVLAAPTSDAPAKTPEKPGATPPLPTAGRDRRWNGSASAPAQLASLQQNGLILDRISTPDENPWRRRVRVADLAFLNDNRAAVVTYDGDVWLLDGLADPALAKLIWRRFASGLVEPLAITAPGGTIQVATKNGVVRLHDRDGNGEADWFENFNDHMIQSQSTRSFPLDMAMGPDGSTFVSQGGIVTRSGLISGGDGTSQSGGILRISPDGKSSELFSSGAREPFVTVHPKTGIVTSTDQQGHFIPSSVSYLVRRGDDFGFPQEKPANLALPLVWIPHEYDSSSTSEAWLLGKAMGPFDGRLLHLSYGTGRLFLVSPDLDAPMPQGAVIPLDLKTDLPLLHARMNPPGDAMFLAGFQIWGTRTMTNSGLGRLRRGTTPIVSAIGARSCADGVILEFAEPLDPASLQPEKVQARAWNYKRSSAYGSGRYDVAGAAGTTPWGVAQAVLSTDRKSVFVHLPELPPVMQLEVRHDFRLASGDLARGVVYLTIHQPRKLELAQAGFPGVDLTRTAAVVTLAKEGPPSIALGKTVSETLGCIACHSIDGTTEGKVGTTWRRLYGSKRTFVDGTSEVADEVYLREKILDPQGKKLKPGEIEMPSYRGVLSEQQLESVILYIKSLGGRRQIIDG